MNIGFLVLAFALGFLFGGAIIFLLLKRGKTSGILHIKQTKDKDYYTIEILDDLESISSKKHIFLKIDTTKHF